MNHKAEFHEDDIEQDDEQAQAKKVKGRTADYESKRRRAERILEQARLRDLLGFDVDYND